MTTKLHPALRDYRHVETAENRSFADFLASPEGKAAARMAGLLRDLDRAIKLVDRLNTEQRRLRKQMERTWGDDPEAMLAAMNDDARRLMREMTDALVDLSGITSGMQWRHDYLSGDESCDPDPR